MIRLSQELYQVARERKENEREAFLREACTRDEAMRREVESLPGYDGQAESFIESPALDLAARELAEQETLSLIYVRLHPRSSLLSD